MREAIDKHEGGLEKFSRGYEKFGFIRRYIICLGKKVSNLSQMADE